MDEIVKGNSMTNKLATQTVDETLAKVHQFEERGELRFPANYSPENAMKAAWLTIMEVVDRNDKPAMEVCTKGSIVNALLDMVVQGLNPAKKQCYFIVYGKKLALQRSYFGSMHIAKTVDPDIKDIYGEVIYEGDIFKYAKKQGRTVILEHQQELKNIKKDKIIGAYAVILYKDGSESATVMTLEEIKAAWKMSKTNSFDEKGNIKESSTHGKFTAEMAKKTAINRACKTVINSSDDSSLIVNTYNRTDADLAEMEAREEIEANANTIYVDVDEDTGEALNIGDGENAPSSDVADDLP